MPDPRGTSSDNRVQGNGRLASCAAPDAFSRSDYLMRKGNTMLGNSSRPTRLTSRSAAAATAAVLAIAFAGAALAQPFGGHGGHRGPMSGGDDMFGPLIAHAKANLNLNTSQQTMFDAAVAQSKAAHEQD